MRMSSQILQGSWVMLMFTSWGVTLILFLPRANVAPQTFPQGEEELCPFTLFSFPGALHSGLIVTRRGSSVGPGALILVTY